MMIDTKKIIEEEVADYNKRFSGIEYKDDYKYPFAITQKMLEQIEESPHNLFGGIKQLATYSAHVCEDLGYIPHTLVYNKFEEGDEGGSHYFYLLCKDKRLIK